MLIDSFLYHILCIFRATQWFSMMFIRSSMQSMYVLEFFNDSGIIIIIIAPRLLPFRRLPAVGFGPKLEEMNPRTFPDLTIRPRTFDFDQKTLKITTNNSNKLL